MSVRSGQRAKEAAVAWFLGAAALATILVLIGFGPIRGWRSSATLLAEGRAAERAEVADARVRALTCAVFRTRF